MRSGPRPRGPDWTERLVLSVPHAQELLAQLRERFRQLETKLPEAVMAY